MFVSALVGQEMAVLFRPWAQPDQLHQDHTVTTTTHTKETKEESNVPREVKFKSVKEHMRKRSEKKLKRIRQESEHHTELSQKMFPLYSESPKSVPINPAIYPQLPLPCHIDPFVANLEMMEGPYKDCWEELGIGSPELLEAAISQGLAPGLLEEYARVLTEQQRQIAEKNRKQRPKKFRCPHCQVGFSNNGQLKGHIRIHTGERPYKCEAEQCGKSFTRNEELTRHRRIHSGLRPFPCPECGKRFGRKDHLKKHVRTHYHQRYQLVPILPSHYPFLLGL